MGPEFPELSELQLKAAAVLGRVKFRLTPGTLAAVCDAQLGGAGRATGGGHYQKSLSLHTIRQAGGQEGVLDRISFSVSIWVCSLSTEFWCTICFSLLCCLFRLHSGTGAFFECIMKCSQEGS